MSQCQFCHQNEADQLITVLEDGRGRVVVVHKECLDTLLARSVIYCGARIGATPYAIYQFVSEASQNISTEELENGNRIHNTL